VLPIELLYFTAEPKGENVLCSWETASETNNDYFEVERSNDGRDFKPISRQKGFGNGTSTENRKYTFVDPETCKDIIYYRLKQMDMDGMFSYSNVVAVNCQESKNDLAVHPNPAQSIITISFIEMADGYVTVKLTDYTGRNVLTKNVEAVKGFNQVPISIDELNKGVYYIEVRSAKLNSENSRQIRFIKD